MPTSDTPQLDVLIIGGGIAGLWTLDELARRGHSCALIERDALGSGQTIWSQGIIHGGLKYTLSGLMNSSAEAIRDMPLLWRRCLAGVREPNLAAAAVRSEHCYLWQTGSLASRLGMIGARAGLRVAPVVLEPDRRPPLLRDCPGTVAQLDEQVIDPAAVLGALAARNAGRVARAEVQSIEQSTDAARITLRAGSVTRIAARWVVLGAGNGNAALRQMLALDPGRVQVRPLRMVMLRGESLPELNGHCVDGAKTRVTITTARDARGRNVWQIGGDIAERGVSMDGQELIRFARAELHAVLPGLNLAACEWATYDAPRAEAAMPGRRRPDDAVVLEDGRILTAFPTKLALAPRVADIIAALVGDPGVPANEPLFIDWERPSVAAGPWESARWSVID